MNSRPPDWTQDILVIAASAPGRIRALASAELHIGGFTNVQLATPTLDLGPVDDPQLADTALLFFLATALAGNARSARVRCQRGPHAQQAIARSKLLLRGAIERIDGDNVALMRYFDIYLKACGDVARASGERIARALRSALAAEPGRNDEHQE